MPRQPLKRDRTTKTYTRRAQTRLASAPVRPRGRTDVIHKGHALDLLESLEETPALIVTDPPYAFGGTGDEHAISATVATVLRESARRLAKGRWMLVMCAASWRSTAYMVEAVRGVVEPVRIATWCKPSARTKVQTTGWAWASVNVIAFKKGRAIDLESAAFLDHITAAPVMNGRRAELPMDVARWMVGPFAVPGALMLDPFAGSGTLLRAAEELGMRSLGFEMNPQGDFVNPKANHACPAASQGGEFSSSRVVPSGGDSGRLPSAREAQCVNADPLSPDGESKNKD